ncbi:Der GTPase-activating protein YihI [Colwellia sp. 1_MG-2023]|uniref:Der GTPase-activating protein YihI n=1 Tax=Colwellia sp. 1_MG-2023 TaxID=3062649 RepID=UPI0026E300F0|nr:Der GTPase-activating protein YihI [Colwellia sp. 1_MG-2023]MDO6444938.1 Der GTPase-activating protein YihI [Colwellia sp. 1_MG-2023]
MSRKKKSRKPGIAPISANKEDRKKTIEVSNKRVKKKHGKAPGNRQQEAQIKQNKNITSSTNKDPRIGNKTPIVLTKTTPAEKQSTPKKVKSSPIAAIRMIDNQQAYEEELYEIEADPRIQQILQKQDEDITLSEEEIDYFNLTMDRHSTLREKLGLTDDDDDMETSEQPQSEVDEDALWDKLDNNKFSDFE